MSKQIFLFLSFFIIISCNTKVNKLKGDKEVIFLQKKAANHTTTDSSLFYLKTAKKILIENTTIADSLRNENNYLLGQHYRQKGILDSASSYFHKVINVVDSI